jgi:hypothetical protein
MTKQDCIIKLQKEIIENLHSLDDKDWDIAERLMKEVSVIESEPTEFSLHPCDLEQVMSAKEPEEELFRKVYEKEFVEWICYGSHPFVHWFDETGHYFTDELTPQRWSIDELYDYWKTLTPQK